MKYAIGQYLLPRYHKFLQPEYPHPVLNTDEQKIGRKLSIDYVVDGFNNKTKKEQIRFALETKWCSGSSTLVKDILIDLIRLALLGAPNQGSLEENDSIAAAYFILGGIRKSMLELLSQSRTYKISEILPLKGVTTLFETTKQSIKSKTTQQRPREEYVHTKTIPLEKLIQGYQSHITETFKNMDLPEKIIVSQIGWTKLDLNSVHYPFAIGFRVKSVWGETGSTR